jgi:hypothetical protein
MNWRRLTGGRGGIVATILAAVLASIVCVPAVLAFPYKQQIGATTIRSEVPIDPRITVELARADALLKASPIDAPVARDIYLTNGGWRWSVLSLTSRGAFAFRRPLRDAIIVNRSDVANDRVYNRPGVSAVRTLSGVIAHETTHILLARHFGELAMLGKPTWKQEGYADYVAQESSLSDTDAAQLRAAGSSNPALVYYDGRRRVAAVLAANAGSIDRLFE